jgi:hypothetical protein
MLVSCMKKNCWKSFGVDYVQRAELCSENCSFRMYEFLFLKFLKS